MVPPSSNRMSRVPPYSHNDKKFTNTGLSPSTALFSKRFLFFSIIIWPGPISLAATFGVSVDFLSSSYLDVSVRWVRFFILCIQIKIPFTRWVAPFGYPRINGCSHLPVAYRSVLRPSSPLSAKASTRCSLTLISFYKQRLFSLFVSYIENSFSMQIFTLSLRFLDLVKAFTLSKLHL